MNNRYMKIFAFGLAAALLMAGLKLCEYYFFSYTLHIEAYLAIIALIFLAIGVGTGYTLMKYTAATGKGINNNNAISREPSKQDLLTGRESEVLHLIALGCSNQQIADHLFVSMNTVKTHVKNIYSKLGVRRRTQAVAEAKRLQILD